MRRGRLILAVGAAAFAACGSSTSASRTQTTGAGIVATPVTADPTRTPGVPSPAVTQATIHATICVSGWTKTVRPPASYTDRLKVQQLAADSRYTDHNPAHFEEDHLIPLE